MRIIISAYAMKETEERLFPDSKHRSKRVLKKLIKRFGGEFKVQGCIFMLNDHVLVCHPSRKAELERILETS